MVGFLLVFFFFGLASLAILLCIDHLEDLSVYFGFGAGL